MVDFSLKVGDKVRSRLDREVIVSAEYIGTIIDITTGMDEGGYYCTPIECLRVTIRRDDKQRGSGVNNEWLILVTNDNKQHISSTEWDLEVNYK